MIGAVNRVVYYVFIGLKKVREPVEHGKLDAHTYLPAGPTAQSGSASSCVWKEGRREA